MSKINLFSSFLQDDNADDQCILIEDDVDQFGLEDTVENTESEKDPKKVQSNYSGDDSEVIPDDEKFQNEDVEFISEGDVEQYNQKESTQLSSSGDPQEVIEISDHESDVPPKKSEPDTEAVSEDELPTETTKVFFLFFSFSKPYSLEMLICHFFSLLIPYIHVNS